MQRNTVIGGAIAVLVAATVAAYVLWLRSNEPPPAAPPLPVVADAASAVPAPAPAPPVAPAPSASAPMPPASAPAPEPPLPATQNAVESALTSLLGRDAVLKWLQTDGFATRVVATVDNLPRGHAAPRVWPVNPIEGRFTVDDDNRIAAANAARYEPFVALVQGTDPAAAAALYRRLSPQLQTAFEELGYPGRRFHDRLLKVLDHLLATPTLTGPPEVTLTDVKGPIASERPWVRYEFADPGLESLSAGQKMLLRLGPAEQQRMKVWLSRFRDEVRASGVR